MPSSKNYKRDYKQENKTAKKRRETGAGSKSGDATRHRARNDYVKRNGALSPDTHVDHKNPLQSGGSSQSSNLASKSGSENMAHGGKIGNTAGKSKGGKKSKRKRKIYA
jgi:hypothetical protein